MLAAVERIHRLVRDQVTRKGIDEDRIVLAGFSQGGSSLSLIAALSTGGLDATTSPRRLRDGAPVGALVPGQAWRRRVPVRLAPPL